METHWDHSSKPSTFVVSDKVGKGKYSQAQKLFRGNYRDGIMFIKSREMGGMVSFAEDYLPAMQIATKRAYEALVTQKQLRQEIIKLKKQIRLKDEKG